MNDKVLMIFLLVLAKEISDSVPPANKTPDDLHERPNILALNFGAINPSEFVDIVKSLESKASVDVDGISSKLLKQICTEIARPLFSHFHNKFTKWNFSKKIKNQ